MKTAEFLSDLPTRMRGPKDNIAEIFLRPALKICKLYRRNTAWFRQSAMGIYAPSLRHFIDNDAKMEMLVSLTGSVDSNIIEALEKAAKEGKGAAQLEGRMIDAASARMAENIVNINHLIESK